MDNCTAVLQQETGRKVRVELGYWWDALLAEEGTGMGVRLVPGAKGLPIKVVDEGVKERDMLMYEPEGTHREGERKRNKTSVFDRARPWFGMPT
jgi:hypothetical protein